MFGLGGISRIIIILALEPSFRCVRGFEGPKMRSPAGQGWGHTCTTYPHEEKHGAMDRTGIIARYGFGKTEGIPVSPTSQI